MGRNLLGYDSIERVPLNDERARVYVVHRRGKKFWIGWMNPMGVYLPEDSYKQVPVQLYTGGNAVTVEPVITGMGQRIAQRQQVPTPGGQAQLNLSFTPIYIFSDN